MAQRSRTHVLYVDGPKGSNYSGGHTSSLCKTPTGGHTRNQLGISSGVQSSSGNEKVYELPAIESLGTLTACIRVMRQY